MFRDAWRNSAWYEQIISHRRYCGVGMQDLKDGQCSVPVTAFAAGTMQAMSREWRGNVGQALNADGVAEGVRTVDLKGHLIRQGFFLERNTFKRDLLFFQQTTGSWIATCLIGAEGKLGGEQYEHFIGFDAWRGVVFEPLNNVLAPLELTDITAGLNIKIFLEKLGISKVTGYGQLWKRLASLNPDVSKESDGGEGLAHQSSPRSAP